MELVNDVCEISLVKDPFVDPVLSTPMPLLLDQCDALIVQVLLDSLVQERVIPSYCPITGDICLSITRPNPIFTH